MTELTPRLQIIADEIKQGETMADIGTDHGFLPIYLWEEGISPHVILADVSKGSLEKARENCHFSHPEHEFDLRLGSGLEILQNGEVDAVVMAGMGGILMTELMEADLEKSQSIKKYVLQPRKDVGKLRCWLYNHGFSVVNEKLVREGKFICEVLTVVPKEVAITRQMDENDIEYEFPHNLVDYKNELTEEYLQRKLDLETMIFESMQQGRLTTWEELRRQDYRIYYLKYLIRKCQEAPMAHR